MGGHEEGNPRVVWVVFGVGCGKPSHTIPCWSQREERLQGLNEPFEAHQTIKKTRKKTRLVFLLIVVEQSMVQAFKTITACTGKGRLWNLQGACPQESRAAKQRVYIKCTTHNTEERGVNVCHEPSWSEFLSSRPSLSLCGSWSRWMCVSKACPFDKQLHAMTL